MIYDMQIKTMLNGWIVTVGCQTLVFTDRDKMVQAFLDYNADPEGTEKRFVEDSVNSKVFRRGNNCTVTGAVAGTVTGSDFVPYSEPAGMGYNRADIKSRA